MHRQLKLIALLCPQVTPWSCYGETLSVHLLTGKDTKQSSFVHFFAQFYIKVVLCPLFSLCVLREACE